MFVIPILFSFASMFVLRKLRAHHSSSLLFRWSSNSAVQFDLEFNDLTYMLQRQQYKCYYSGIPMNCQENTDWKMSLERLDNREGYTRQNCVLICWEFNTVDNSVRSKFNISGSYQWNREKFVYFYRTKFGEEPPPL